MKYSGGYLMPKGCGKRIYTTPTSAPMYRFEGARIVPNPDYCPICESDGDLESELAQDADTNLSDKVHRLEEDEEQRARELDGE